MDMNPCAVRRYALALDLVDDPARIEAYEEAHRNVWPEVLGHLRAHGVLGMEIYRLGTRLFMVMEVDPDCYDPERMAREAAEDPAIVRWETWMWTYQLPTPWTPAGEKWVPMRRIFDFAAC